MTRRTLPTALRECYHAVPDGDTELAAAVGRALSVPAEEVTVSMLLKMRPAPTRAVLTIELPVPGGGLP
jgi:hypothetical protein